MLINCIYLELVLISSVDIFAEIIVYVILKQWISTVCLSQMKHQLDATLCLVLFLQSHSTCFGRKRPSSGVFKTSTAATGTCVIVAGKSSPVQLWRSGVSLTGQCEGTSCAQLWRSVTDRTMSMYVLCAAVAECHWQDNVNVRAVCSCGGVSLTGQCQCTSCVQLWRSVTDRTMSMYVLCAAVAEWSVTDRTMSMYVLCAIVAYNC